MTPRIAASLLLAASSACASDVCESLEPAVEISIHLAEPALAPMVKELLVELRADQMHWTRTFAVTTELEDGATSLVVNIDPKPSASFDLAVTVAAHGKNWEQIAHGTASSDASPDGCNQLRVGLLSVAGEPEDAGIEDDGGQMTTGQPDSGQPDSGGEISPAELVFTSAPQTLSPQTCSAPAELEARDPSGNAVPVSNDTSIELSATPRGRLELYADAACGNRVSTVNLSAGSSAAAFYFKASMPGEITIVARASFDEATQRQTIVAPTCQADCNVCDGGCCLDLCQTRDCSLRCDRPGCPCTADCGGTDGTCTSECKRGATCAIDCEGVNNCRATCKEESSCAIDCRSANNCDDTRCTDGSRCILFCDGANNCGFESCSGGAQSCSGDVVVCGRDCP